MKAPSIHWFRLDLRLGDNSALRAAMAGGGPVVPVFIHAPEEESPWEPGAASRWWLHQSLRSLDEDLRRIGSCLVIRKGPSLDTLRSLAREIGAGAVCWNRRVEPGVKLRDEKVRAALRSDGLEVDSFHDALLHDPSSTLNQAGKPFQVFTPYWRSCLKKLTPSEPLPAPRILPAPGKWPKSLPLAALELEPRIRWAEGLRGVWNPGVAGAQSMLGHFLSDALLKYDTQRNYPGLRGTSRLSPHLHFGEITPRQIWHAVRAHAESSAEFVAELGWREFAHHLLFHFPHTPEQPLRADFARFRWREHSEWLEAWQRGVTGYPIVDAGMRELWATGWMHNRVRMIAGSFLVKDLLISWQEGARWFWDTLVDADLASNTLGWQWTAGCGADAAPYFRVFNPVLQGEKFDPDGSYVRRWCPELAKLPNRWVHRPWQAPSEVCADANVELGRTYPRPIVSHAIAREVALEAYNRLKLKTA